LTRTTLIQANNGFHTSHKPVIRFVSRRTHNHFQPSKYALVTFRSGKLERVDYKDAAEFHAHVEAVKAKVKHFHQRIGKQAGCQCGYC